MKKSLERKVYQYSAVFELNEKGGYTVIVPSLPGLTTEGNSLEEAKKMAEDAIKCYIGGLIKIKEVIPEEKEVAHLRLSVKV